MSIKNLRYSFILLALFVFAGTAAAQGPQTSTDTTTATLEMSATVETAVQLIIATNAGAAVTGGGPTGAFLIAFGDVNGLGITAPAANVTVVRDGTNGALYTTPISVTPEFSGFVGGELAHITVEEGGSAEDSLAREGSSAAILAGSVNGVARDVTLTGADAVAITRYVGFFVPRAQAPAAIEATLLYTITVE